MTNLLAVPLVKLTVETGNNEDWVDSVKFVVGVGDPDTLPQLDLRGITFEMEIRYLSQGHEVVLDGTTADGTLQIGTPPDFGFFIFNIPLAEMQLLRAGTYIGDVVGRDASHTRVCMQIDLTIVEGVTKGTIAVP